MALEPEFGCEHLREVLERNDMAAAQFCHLLRAHRARAQQTRAFVIPNGGTGDRGGNGKTGSGTKQLSLKPAYSCLQCLAVCATGERDSHGVETGHRFFTESRGGAIYCRDCGDLVYDLNLERFMMAPSKSRKRVHEEGPEEAAFLAANATKRACGREGLRGLFNLGQTCYMNVILQTLLHDTLLTTYFLGNGHKPYECVEENCISCALTDTFADFNNDEKSEAIVSMNLLYASWMASPELAGNQQQDAHEFYQFLVDRLHSTAAAATANGNPAAITASDQPDQADRAEQAVRRTDCRCFFHKAFFGKLRSTVTCLACGNVTRTDDPIMDLSLAFHAQSPGQGGSGNDGGSSGGTSTGRGGRRTLASCLDSFTAPERLPSYSCTQCGDMPQPATKQLRIGRLPFLLCIQLKLFERTQTNATEKVHGRVDFPLTLDLAPYTTAAKPYRSTDGATTNTSTGGSSFSMNNTNFSNHGPRTRFLYDLSSVIVHSGTLDAGHYVAYVRAGAPAPGCEAHAGGCGGAYGFSGSGFGGNGSGAGFSGGGGQADGVGGGGDPVGTGGGGGGEEGRWFLFNDDKVIPVGVSEVLGANAYLLFYTVRALGAK